MKEESLRYYADKVVELGMLALVFITPLIFFPLAYDVFELPKIVVMRLLTPVILLAWLINCKLTPRPAVTGQPRQDRQTHGQAQTGIGIQSLYLPSLLFLPILFLLLVSLLSTLSSLNLYNSLNGEYQRRIGLYTVINCLILYFIVVNNFKGEKITLLIISIVISASIVAIFGICQHFGVLLFKWTIFPQNQVFSTLGNPVFLAGFLVMVLPLPLSKFLEVKGITKVFYALSFLLIYTALLFTYCRGAYLAFLGSIIIFFLFLGKERIIKGKVSLSLLGLILILITLSMSSRRVVIIEREVSLKERAVSIFDLEDRSVSIRLSTWDGALRMIKDRPIFGFGLDNFVLAFPKYKSVKYGRLAGIERGQARAHNEVLDVSLNSGLLGLFAYLWIIIVFYRKTKLLLRSAVRSKPSEATASSLAYPSRYLFPAFLSSITAFLIHNQFNFSVVSTLMLFWVIVGMGLSEKHPIGGTFLSRRAPEHEKVHSPQSIVHRGQKGRRAQTRAQEHKSEDRRQKTSDRSTGRSAFRHDYIGHKCPPTGWTMDYGLIKGSWKLSIFLLILVASLGIGYITIKEFRADIYFRKGLNEVSERDLTQAIVFYEKAIELYPRELFYTYLASAYEKEVKVKIDEKFVDKTIANYKKAIKINPLNSYNYNNLAKFYLYLGGVEGKDWLNKAVYEHKRAIKLDPLNPVFYNDLANTYINGGELKAAIKLVKKAEELDPNYANIYCSRGNIYYYQGLYDQAISQYKKALRLKENYQEATVNLAAAYQKKGLLEEAVKRYEEALKLSPSSGVTRYNLGIAYQKMGRRRKAERKFKEALLLDPNLVGSDSHYYLGIIYQEEEKFELAKREFEEAIRLNPGHEKARRRLKEMGSI